nr:putative ribonuclease H-like domain-containing protein [Tanacetum cinerariifolium]
MPLGNASRTATILEPMDPRRSTVSKTTLCSNSFAARRDCPIRRQLCSSRLSYSSSTLGAVTIKRVYYVKGLTYNLFSVGQFCDADLEVAFRKSTCFIRDLKGNDLLTGSHGTDLYSIILQDTNFPNPICLMAKVTSSQAWLWHRRLSHLNFDTINLLSKNDIVVGLPKLKFVKDHLCSSWILHQTSVARTPEQNGVVKRRNRTLVEATRTMLSAAKVPLFFWAEAIATACFTQNCSLVIPRHKKTPYHIINDQKPSVKFFHIFGSICYIVRDGENLDKMKEKGNECIFVGYSTLSRVYRVFNKRTRVIMESIHVNFDELPQMASDQLSSDPAPECQTMALEHDSLSPASQHQANVPQADRTVTTSNELDLLFSPMFDELLNGSSKVVSKSSAVSAADAPNQRQQLITPLNIHTTPAPTYQEPTLVPTVSSSENINQAETYAENDQVADDEFINIFSTPTSTRHVDSSNMHTFYQRYPSEHRWIKDHPLEQVIGNPSQSVRTRRQLESDAEMCMFALTVSQTEPKNIKEAMADSAWIESMQEELHQFDQLDIWELVNKPLCTNIINLKWLWKNKRDEENTVIRNKSRLVAKGYAQKEGVDFEESFAPIHHSPRGIFINQAKYAQEILKKHGMTSCDGIGTPMATKHLDADLSGTPVDQTKYRSKVGALMYLTASRPDIMHATCYCPRYQAQPIEKHLTALTDYGFHFDKIPMYCDSKAAIAISCNPVRHSGTKHIDVRYHFIKEKVEKGIVELFFVETEYQLADLFTKALSVERFQYLVRRLGMRCLTPAELEARANESA